MSRKLKIIFMPLDIKYLCEKAVRWDRKYVAALIPSRLKVGFLHVPNLVETAEIIDRSVQRNETIQAVG